MNKEKWRERKSGILIRTISGVWDALELLAKRHDHEFFDPDEVHAEAVKQLFTLTGNKYLPVFIEIMKDKSYDWLTRVYALGAANMTRNEYVRNALRELADDEETLPAFAKKLADAFYRQCDIEYLEKISLRTDLLEEKDLEHVKWNLEALSRKVDKEWSCPYLDEHGFCIKKAFVSGCSPRAYARTSYDYRRCPTYLSPSPF